VTISSWSLGGRYLATADLASFRIWDGMRYGRSSSEQLSEDGVPLRVEYPTLLEPPVMSSVARQLSPELSMSPLVGNENFGEASAQSSPAPSMIRRVKNSGNKTTPLRDESNRQSICENEVSSKWCFYICYFDGN
jgi:hypothetical protein